MFTHQARAVIWYTADMSVQTAPQIGDPVLRAKNQPLHDFSDRKVQAIIDDLIETMRQKGLIGMAAPQIGENIQIFVTEPRETPTRTKDQTDELRVYVNPSIVDFSQEQNVIFEGCGSVLSGELFGPVERSRQVTIEAFDRNGKRFRLTADGILGRVIQHEYDHLNGVLFLERVLDYRQVMNREHYVQHIKNSPELKSASVITTMKHTVL